MHIAFLNRSFYPDTTATGQLLTELCLGLRKDFDCRVSVITGPASQNGDLEGIEVIRAHGTRFSKKHFAGRFSNYVTYFLSASYAAFRLDRPDIVVALTDPPIIGLAGLAARRGGRFVFYCQDVFPEVAALLRPHLMIDVDITGSIGRRYRRQDEVGTPLCVTVDFDTLDDRAVTIRDRDTMEQARVPIVDLRAELDERLAR